MSDQQSQRDLATADDCMIAVSRIGARSTYHPDDVRKRIVIAIAAAREQGIAQGRADGLREAVALSRGLATQALAMKLSGWEPMVAALLEKHADDLDARATSAPPRDAACDLATLRLLADAKIGELSSEIARLEHERDALRESHRASEQRLRVLCTVIDEGSNAIEGVAFNDELANPAWQRILDVVHEPRDAAEQLCACGLPRSATRHSDSGEVGQHAFEPRDAGDQARGEGERTAAQCQRPGCGALASHSIHVYGDVKGYHVFDHWTESASEVCARLGIDVSKWAAEVRAKVDAAGERDKLQAALAALVWSIDEGSDVDFDDALEHARDSLAGGDPESSATGRWLCKVCGLAPHIGKHAEGWVGHHAFEPAERARKPGGAT